jgi:hypothetical protein
MRICANILAQIKSLTFAESTKKLRAILSYKKGARKMLVKLTPDRHFVLRIRLLQHNKPYLMLLLLKWRQKLLPNKSLLELEKDRREGVLGPCFRL